MSWANHDSVLRQMRAAGLLVADPLRLTDGNRSTRCLVEDGGREKRGWYFLREWRLDDGTALLAGSFGVFQGDSANPQKIELTKCCASCGAEIDLREKVCPACGNRAFKNRELTDEQKAAWRESVLADRLRAAAEQAVLAERASQWATAVWRACAELAPGGHPYLVRKQLAGTGGARQFNGVDGLTLSGAEADDYRYLSSFAGHLAVPLCDENGKIFGLQFIAPKRDPKTGQDKRYWPRDMLVSGHSWTIGGSPRRLGLVAEGFATALTLHEATGGQPVTVAFAANNLLPVTKALVKRTRGRAKLLICADDDWLQKCLECKHYTPVGEQLCRNCGKPHRQGNAGVGRARDVAFAVSQAEVFQPTFAAERQADRKGPTDFNDLACLEGQQVVTAQYERRLMELEWQEMAASAPRPASDGRRPPTDGSSAGGNHGGGGGQSRPPAMAIMDLDDLIERFWPIDDGTGDCVFDTWTRRMAKRSQMIALLPAGVRGDDIKRHHRWISRGACYLEEVGFDPAGTDELIKLNTWRGWPLKPKAGRCERMLDLVEYLCSGDAHGPKVARWLLQWMAYPLQNPGAKMSSAVIMHGPQGTGKSTLFQCLARIYGDYATVLNQRGLEDRFNSDWTDSKLFILAEEVVTRAEMWHIKGELKELVTGEWIRINEKQLKAYRQRNHVNLVLLSNEGQPLPLDNDDRRHLVIYTPPELSEQYYDELRAEIDSGGVEAFYHNLLHLDLTGFHPNKRPPMTAAKQALIGLSKGSEARFIDAWIEGDLELPVCPCKSTDLYAKYLSWCKRNGEFKPRPSSQFFGWIGNMPGWDKRKARHYRDLTSTEAQNSPIVTPPLEILQASGFAPPAGESSRTRWLTECVLRFANDAKFEGGGAGAGP